MLNSELPLHHHTAKVEELKEKLLRNNLFNSNDINFLMDTIEQLEGELKEWMDLYETNITMKRVATKIKNKF